MRFLVPLALCMLLLSCTDERKSSQIVIPRQLEYLNSHASPEDTLTSILNESTYNIISRINGDSITCHDELQLWEQYIREIRQSNIPVSFYIILTTNNPSPLKSALSQSPHLYACFIDHKQAFQKKNKGILTNAGTTFLTNADNEIIVRGNPVKEIKKKLKFLEVFKTDQLLKQTKIRH